MPMPDHMKQSTRKILPLTFGILAACFGPCSPLSPLSPHAQAQITVSSYVAGSSANATINSSTSHWARFTPSSTTNATQGWLRFGTLAGSPTVRVGIQADNGSGLPSGTYLTSSVVSPTANAWNLVDFADQSLTSGSSYFLVAQIESGTSAVVTYRDAANSIQGNGNLDSSWTRGSNSATATGQLNFALDTSSGYNIGNPYVAANITGSTVATSRPTQRFVFDTSLTGGNTQISSFTAELSNNVASAFTGNLTMTLRNAALETVATQTLSSVSIAANSGVAQTFSFATPVTLTNGSTYYASLGSSGSGGVANWRFFSTNGEAPQTELRDASWQGTNGAAGTYNESTPGFSITNSGDRDFYFSYATVPEPSTWALVAISVVFGVLQLKKRRNS